MSNTHEPLTAKDIMVTELVTLSPEMDVYDAIDRLLQYHISGAPVVDNHGCLVGIFSEKDCMRVLLEGTYDGLPTNTVGAFMRTQVEVLEEDTDLLSIAHTFLNTSYRRLPVVRNGKVVGQISRRDLLKKWSELLRSAPSSRSSYLYLSLITDRRESPIA